MRISAPFSPATGLLVGLLLAFPACRPVGIQVGETLIPEAALERASQEMAQTFNQFGKSTLIWEMLREGWGAAWILHSKLPRESALARLEALQMAQRLRAGSTFEELARDLAQMEPDEDPAEYARAPNPHNIGGRAAAAVAALEEGEWAGPLRTLDGWELVYLRRRFEGHRTRAGVQLIRMVYPVGSAVAQEQAKDMWNTLPLSGPPQLMKALPASFRHGRVQSDS
ncbi:MAG: peptidylprolyl isomerase [Planctomycetota bacterium]|nr:peptidylprolyl isomerase [Planctomycetota bacterium]MDP6942292.1 peptidylprolyl isomerase [Planctomycetota bacterium]